jgi:hypothetical protein
VSDQNDAADDALLAGLRAAFESNVPVPPSMVDMIMAGYDITNIDAHIAELVEESQLADNAGVRSTPLADSRLLVFEFGEVRFDFELRSEAPQIIGHVDGATDGTIHLEQAESSERAPLDQNGAFEFVTRSGAPFRLRLELPVGKPIATEWILP